MGTGVSKEHTPASTRPSTQEAAAANLQGAIGTGGGAGSSGDAVDAPSRAAKGVQFGRVGSARGDEEVRQALKERGCIMDMGAVEMMRQRAASASVQAQQGMDEVSKISLPTQALRRRIIVLMRSLFGLLLYSMGHFGNREMGHNFHEERDAPHARSFSSDFPSICLQFSCFGGGIQVQVVQSWT